VSAAVHLLGKRLISVKEPFLGLLLLGLQVFVSSALVVAVALLVTGAVAVAEG
jgi:hypothetical protein